MQKDMKLLYASTPWYGYVDSPWYGPAALNASWISAIVILALLIPKHVNHGWKTRVLYVVSIALCLLAFWLLFIGLKTGRYSVCQAMPFADLTGMQSVQMQWEKDDITACASQSKLSYACGVTALAASWIVAIATMLTSLCINKPHRLRKR